MAVWARFSALPLRGFGSPFCYRPSHNSWNKGRLFSTAYGETIQVFVRQGFPVLTLPLPSRNEQCEFSLRPYLQTVSTLQNNIKKEDGGIDRIALYSSNGVRIAQSTGLDILLREDFEIEVNNMRYKVTVEDNASDVPLKGEKSLSDVRNMIHKLYTSLNVDVHQLSKERDLTNQLQQLKSELGPLEEQCSQLMTTSDKRANIAMWSMLGVMCVQAGFLGRLTFVNYSWDIMEPITYFVTYGTGILCFAYYLLTKQDYVYPDVQDRQKMTYFYRGAKSHNFDVAKYNHLKETVAQVEGELKRLHDPLQLNLPTPDPPKQQD